MLQPKKPNPAQKTKRKTAPGQYTSDIDWDQVRSVNDNAIVQAAKMIDPTGVTSYPDVYYAGKDLYEGKGSVGNLALNILGALPMVGKAKVLFNLAKASKASKTVKNTKKVFSTIENIAEKANKVTNPLKIKPVFKVKPQTIAKKNISKADVKNLSLDLLDIGNVSADMTSVGKAATPVAEEVSKKVEKLLEEPSVLDKEKIKKTIQYYNRDPKRGKVETPGQLANVDYRTINNSAELKMWEQQKLVYGTGNQGIMKRKMNPRKKYANGTTPAGVGPNNYIQSPNEVLNDYNIMLAEADQQVASNSLVPVVSLVGGLAQEAIKFGGAGGFSKEAWTKPPATAANGMNNVNQDVEVEGGERYETPQGETGEFQGPSHEQGGMPMEVGQDIPEGTKVYSDRLKVGKETLAERKEARERKIANLEKIASQPLLDSAVKNATQRKMQSIQKEEMADLQFQEQVNNMQQMADNVIAAFGTSMKGLQANPMKYEDGTGPAGIKYGKGYDANMFKDFYAKYNELNPGGVMDMNFIQGDLGIESKTPGFGKVFGPGTYKASQDWLAANKDKKVDGYVTGDANGDGISDSLGSNPNINLDALKNFKIGEGINDNASLSYGNPYTEDGVNSKMPSETIMTPVEQYGNGVDTGITPETDLPGNMFSRGLSKVGTAVDKMGGVPGMGDIASLFGDYLGATSGLKNAAEQRSSDITHRNVYANAGKETQKQLDTAMSSIENAKAQAIVKATTTTQGGKKSGRNAARGINQSRAMDWLYDTALNQNIIDISTGAAGQIADIFKTKGTVALSVDQLKGQGEYQANMANEAAKDAYYTAKGLALRDQANAIKQGGKDLNAMKQNKIIENLMKGYGKYVTADASGLKAKKSVDTEEGKDIFTTPDGKKYKIGRQGKLIQIT